MYYVIYYKVLRIYILVIDRDIGKYIKLLEDVEIIWELIWREELEGSEKMWVYN